MRLTGTVFRAHNPRWSFAPISGDGAARYGGRFNPVGVPTLYTSLRPEVAWREAQQGFAFKPQPLTLVAYDVDCDDVADLTDSATLEDLGLLRADLACAWEAMMLSGSTPPTWQVGERLRTDGFAAALVPSFAPGPPANDRNVVFWHWSGAPPHKVVVMDDEGRLPRNDASWRG